MSLSVALVSPMIRAVSIFREQAVRQYSDPDQRGGLLRATPPSGLALFVPLALLFVAVAVIASVQKVNVTARGRGIVRPADGVRPLRAPVAGELIVHDVSLGNVVEAGTQLFTVRHDDGETTVVAPVDARIDAWRVPAGDRVTAGTPVVRLVPTSETLVAVFAIPAEHRASLVHGAEIRLRLDEHPFEQYGLGLARVVHVSSEPIGDGYDDPFVAAIAGESGPSLYEVELEPVSMPPRSKSSFRSGMTFTGEVVLREQRVIALLLGT